MSINLGRLEDSKNVLALLNSIKASSDLYDVLATYLPGKISRDLVVIDRALLTS